MNQTRINYQQFINDIYTSQKHVLSLITKLSDRFDNLEAQLRTIKDDQNIHLSAVKNSLHQLKEEINQQYTQESTEIDELNDVLAGELENLDVIPKYYNNKYSTNFDNNYNAPNINILHTSVPIEPIPLDKAILDNGKLLNLDSLIDNTPLNAVNFTQSKPLIL